MDLDPHGFVQELVQANGWFGPDLLNTFSSEKGNDNRFREMSTYSFGKTL